MKKYEAFKLPNIKLFLTAVALLSSIFCQSCSKEKTEDSESVSVRISFTLPAGVPKENIELLVFDGNGYLAGRWGQCPDGTTISIGEGRYTFIACSGVGRELVMSPETMIIGQTRISGITVSPCGEAATNPCVGILADIRISRDAHEQNITIKLSPGNDDMAIGIGLLEWGNISGTDLDM